MADDRVKLIFDLLTGKKEVSKELDRTKIKTKDLEKSTVSLKDSFLSVKTAIIGVGAVIAGLGIQKIIQAATTQEDAIRRLNIAMAQSGEFSIEASKGLQQFASALQENSRFGDEQILSQLALAKSFGATNDEAKKLVQAAVDMSAALGIDVRSAIVNLSKSTSGLLGELGEVVGETRNLTKEQLKSGGAIDLVAKKFKGFAEKEMQGFSGQTNRITKLYGDLLEELGKTITTSPEIIKALESIADVLSKLIKSIPTVTKKISGFIGGLKDWASTALDVITGNKTMNFVMERQSMAVGNVDRNTKNLTKTNDKFTQSLITLSKNASKTKDKLEELGPKIKFGDGSQTDLASKFKIQDPDIRKLTNPMEVFKLFGQGMLSALGPFGNALNGVGIQFIDIFGQAPEQFDKMLNNLATKLPTILTNILINLTTFLTAQFVETFVVSLINELPRITEALVTVIVTQFSNPIFWVSIATTAAAAFVNSIPDIVQGFINGIKDGAGQFVEALIKAITGIGGVGGAVGGLLSNVPVVGGAASSIVSSIGGSLGFSKGGIVPGIGNKDTVPAVLTPGERVLTKSQNKNFEELMAMMMKGGGQGGGGNINVTLKIGQRELANVYLILIDKI